MGSEAVRLWSCRQYCWLGGRVSERVRDWQRSGTDAGVLASIVGLAEELARVLEVGSEAVQFWNYRQYCWTGGRVSERVRDGQRSGTYSEVTASIVGLAEELARGVEVEAKRYRFWSSCRYCWPGGRVIKGF